MFFKKYVYMYVSMYIRWLPENLLHETNVVDYVSQGRTEKNRERGDFGIEPRSKFTRVGFAGREAGRQAAPRHSPFSLLAKTID